MQVELSWGVIGAFLGGAITIGSATGLIAWKAWTVFNNLKQSAQSTKEQADIEAAERRAKAEAEDTRLREQLLNNYKLMYEQAVERNETSTRDLNNQISALKEEVANLRKQVQELQELNHQLQMKHK